MKFTAEKGGWLVFIIYLVGFISFLIPQTSALVNRLIWLNLCFTFTVLMVFHKNWSKEFVLTMLMLGICGYLVEVLGVRTGRIFGHYSYGWALGYKLMRTPLMMALIWFSTLYITRQVAEMLFRDIVAVSITAAVLMLALDFFIEPFAVRTGMWSWSGNHIPTQNYVAWFVTGFILQYVFLRSVKLSRNKLALPVYLIQFAFFISLYLFW